MEKSETRVRVDAVEQADVELLATLGYKQEFKRAFSALESFGLAFSVFGLVPSIATVMSYPIPNGGPVAMVWGWFVASLFILCIGMSMGELASSQPTSGGLYYWTHSLSSPKYRNVLAWFVGYANTIGSIASVASIVWGTAVQVMAAASIGSGGSFIPTNAQLFGVYCAVIITNGLLCSLGTRVLARLQTVYIVLNIALCLAIFIALPVLTPKEYRNSASFALGGFGNFSGWPDGFAFILSFLAPVWTIGSFDCVVHISEETANAATAVPWAVVNAIAISGVLGTALMITIAFCMGPDLQAILDSDIQQPMATARITRSILFNSIGPEGTLGIWSVIVIIQFMMGSSMLLASSRQVFAFSRDGALPLSKWLYRINSFTETPVNSVWFSVVVAILLGLLSFAGDAAIDAIFSISVFGTYIAFGIPISVRFIFSKTNNFKPGPFTLGRWGFPIALIAVVFMFVINIWQLFPLTRQTDAASMNYSNVVLGSCLIWFYLPKYGGAHWFTGPVPNVDIDEDRGMHAHGESPGDEKLANQ
ncbi:hypothetical protein BOTBODRAFT_118262 [Botryobasidium botryosum FD-172 SS1]|uniref:Amino acid permease/ SLC12A domain-containing protein n=1 Tax=Botryobasidium botryosum (strain FD-172 SS1) TaxID=930990 RepID=A0A067MA35_BOTB1|nr:hypothetical protein BOTBODRAFT_118262 [Botryobasidium botryosum FD-172 SS1]